MTDTVYMHVVLLVSLSLLFPSPISHLLPLTTTTHNTPTHSHMYTQSHTPYTTPTHPPPPSPHTHTSTGAEPDAGTQRHAAGDASQTPSQHHRASVPAAVCAARHASRPPREAARLRVGQPASLQQEGRERTEKETRDGAQGAPEELEGERGGERGRVGVWGWREGGGK